MLEVKLDKARLYLANCFDLLPFIEDESIDLILTDPPYDNTRYMPSLTRIQKETVAKEFKRVLKRTGNLLLFCGFDDKWTWYEILKEAGLKFRREIIWVYDNPSNYPPPKNIQASHETCLWFSKLSKRYYFKQGVMLRTWVNCPTPSGILREFEVLNITPKPVPLLIRLIEFSCPLGGLVLDPFMGTGSTGVACMKTGRRFIGIEIKRKYFDLAVERVKRESKQVDLSLFVEQ